MIRPAPMILLAALCALPAAAQDAPAIPEPLGDILDARAADCAIAGGGEMTVEEGALVRADLTGDAIDDWVLDETHLSCSTAASLLCGTGGCNVNFLVGDTVTTRLSKGWALADFPPLRVVLVQVHGANCGGTNLNACVEAMVWDPAEKRFYSLAAIQ